MSEKTKSLLPSIFLGVFALDAISNLWAEASHNVLLIYLTKPVLITSLLLYFYCKTLGVPSRFRTLMLFGFLFSIAGDTLLMFVEQSSNATQFFIAGLGCFLITQVAYTLAFWNYPNAKTGLLARRPWMALPVVLYGFGLLSYLWPDLPSDMRIPVGVYGVVITTMAVAALHLNGRLEKQVFIELFCGVLLFLFSDSCIALDKFKSAYISLPEPRLVIMITYLLGQYLIAQAAIKANNVIKFSA